MATKHHRTAAQLVRIYQLTKEGTPRQQVASELGIDPEQVSSSYALLTKYLRGKARDQQHQSRVYREAAKQIRSLLRSQKRVVKEGGTITPPHNGYDFLQKSFSRFQESIATFIEVEVNTRVQATATENARLREEVETLRKQVNELTERLEALPKTDLVASLKSKLTDVDTAERESFEQIELKL